MADLYHILTGVAMNPTIATPGTTVKEKPWKNYITISIVAGIVIITGLAGFKILKHHTTLLK